MDVAARLGIVCRRARKAAGHDAIRIAVAAGVSEATVSRFENGWKLTPLTERLVAAYGRECGLEPLELWRAALDLEDNEQEE